MLTLMLAALLLAPTAPPPPPRPRNSHRIPAVKSGEVLAQRTVPIAGEYKTCLRLVVEGHAMAWRLTAGGRLIRRETAPAGSLMSRCMKVGRLATAAAVEVSAEGGATGHFTAELDLEPIQ